MDTERRLEILGILIISLSVFILVSLTGYNPNEEPHISPNVKITNPMGIMGLLISYFMIKKGFGFIVVILPITGIVWGWFLFSKKKIRKACSQHLLYIDRCCPYISHYWFFQ